MAVRTPETVDPEVARRVDEAKEAVQATGFDDEHHRSQGRGAS